MGELVAIADYDYGDISIETAILTAAGHRVVGLQCKSEADLVLGAPDAVAVMTQYARVGREAIAGMPSLRHIARYGTGVDIVDVAAAAAAGILVTNVPATYCQEEVADHALALLLYFNRQLAAYDAATHNSVWHWQAAAPVHRLSTTIVGIVGLGNIGRQICARLQAFGANVHAYDPFIKPELVPEGVVLRSLADLLPESDYVIVQAPLTEQTRNLFDATTIATMKPGSVLINTSRGPIVQSQALADALQSGHLRGAGLDDLPEEPAKLREWHASNPLFACENCIITPHVAYYSEEAIAVARSFAAEEVVRVLAGQEPLSPVVRPGHQRNERPATTEGN